MRPDPFSEEDKKWIIENYKKYTASYIAKEFGVKTHTIHVFASRNNCKKEKRKPKENVLNDGLFHVGERWNWVI